MLSSAGVVSSSHKSVFRVQPCLRISFASGGRRLWPGIFGSVNARRSERRRASFRMWIQALRCLAALLSQKETSSGKLPRSRRWQREKDNTACTARAVLHLRLPLLAPNEHARGYPHARRSGAKFGSVRSFSAASSPAPVTSFGSIATESCGAHGGLPRAFV